MMSDNSQQAPCSQKSCQSRQFGYSQKDSAEDNSDLSGRPVLYTGVLWIGVLRKFLIPRQGSDSSPCPSQPQSRVSPEARDMSLVTPAYSTTVHRPAHVITKQPEKEQLRRRQKLESKHSPLATLVYQIQETSAILREDVKHLSDDLGDLVHSSKETTRETLQTLRKEGAGAGRYGAITISSLVGYVVALRRGVGVRLVYASTGAAAAATLCYPEEARHYNTRALELVREAVLLFTQLYVQLLHSGIQTPIVVKSRKEAEVHTVHEVEQTRSSERPLVAWSNDSDFGANGKNNIAEFEQKKEQNSQNFNAENTPLQQDIPPWEHPLPTRGGRLSKECQREGTTVVLHTPDLPAPHKVEESDFLYHPHTNNIHLNSPNTNNGNDYLESKTEETINLSPKSCDGSLSPLNDTTSQLELAAIQRTKTNVPENNDLISENKSIEDRMTDISCEDNSFRGQNYPLNKKLSRYYMKKKNDMFTSSERESEKLYSQK